MAVRRIMRVLAALAFAGSTAAAQGAAQAPNRVDLVVAATTDVHGRIRGWDYYADTADAERGLTRAATIIDSIRGASPGRTIVLDAGDFLQGNPFTYVAAKQAVNGVHPVIAAMNAMQYDAVAPGNHEFNYGLPVLDRALAGATFPVIAANVRRMDGKRGWAPAAFVTRAGVRVAIVGATTPWAMVWDKLHLDRKMAMDDIVTSLKRAVKDARAAGAQVVIVLAHAGLDPPNGPSESLAGVPAEHPMSTVARDVPGIDLIVFGHSHREVADTTINGVMLMQPRNWATSVGVATLTLEREGKAWRVAAKRGVTIQSAHHAEQAAMAQLAASTHEAARRYSLSVVGTTAGEWRSDSARTRDVPILDFIGEVMRRATGADLASTAAFSTRIRIPAGKITVAQLAQLYPYDNTLRVVRFSGAVLKEYLEHSATYWVVRERGEAPALRTGFPGYNFEAVTGASYTIDLSRPAGDRILGLAVKGKPVAATDSFTVALTNYRASGTGGYGMLASASVVKEDSREVRQLLIDEVTKKKSISPADYFVDSWKVVPAAYAAAAQKVSDGEPDFETARRPAPGAQPASAGRADGGAVTTIRVIGTNDFHGSLESRTEGNAGRRGGAAEFAAMVKRLERECTGACAPVLVDGGDLFQGTPASNLAYGKPVAAVYNALDYAAAAVGNHDFDWGQDSLRARMRELRFPVLGANVTTANGAPIAWLRADTIVDRGGVKVGIVGLANQGTAAMSKPLNVAGLKFAKAAPVAVERARALRARGAQVVIAVIHGAAECRADACGGEAVEVAGAGAGVIDAVVGGHMHNEFTTVVGRVPVIRARAWGRGVAYVDIPVGGGATPVPHHVFVKTDSITPDPRVAALVAQATASVQAIIERPIATVSERMPREGAQYALGNLLADAHRAACKSDIAAMNTTGIRAELRAGPANYGAFFEVSPFGNVLERANVTGADLRAYAEFLVGGNGVRSHVSGMAVRYDSTRRAGPRVLSVTVGGAPLDDQRTYTICMNDFMVTAGDGRALRLAPDRVEDTGTSDLDALLEYVRALPGGIVRPDHTVRIAPGAP